MDYASLESSSKWRNLPPPPGFAKVSSSSSKTPAKSSSSKATYDELKATRAWDAAIAPAKALPMQAFMLYMSGSGVQIFSMGIVFMLLFTPFKNVAGMNDGASMSTPVMSKISIASLFGLCSIRPIRADQLAAKGIQHARAAKAGLHCLQLAYTCRSGDWLAFETRGLAPEISLY
ncbi:hypothetical protein H0H92_012023 [Tricholoma furcatifolium]|nr:hypothetical protein H0H92_012023 [Tricholoma furcatifolium]